MNGIYEPTAEVCGGFSVFHRQGGASWLEYDVANKKWQVQPTAERGTGNAWATLLNPSLCYPQLCPPGTWQVAVNSVYGTTPSVSVIVAATVNAA